MYDKLRRQIKAQDAAAQMLEHALKQPGPARKVREAFQPDYDIPEDMEDLLRRLH